MTYTITLVSTFEDQRQLNFIAFCKICKNENINYTFFLYIRNKAILSTKKKNRLQGR